MLKNIKYCNTSKPTFVTPQIYSQLLCATIINVKTKDRLVHLNIFLFNSKNQKIVLSKIVHSQMCLSLLSQT